MNTPARSYDDEIDDILSFFGGDAHSAIEALLAERDLLLKELELTNLAMSAGFTRGWKPTALGSETIE